MVVRTFLINALDFECFMGNKALGRPKKMFETCVKLTICLILGKFPGNADMNVTLT